MHLFHKILNKFENDNSKFRLLSNVLKIKINIYVMLKIYCVGNHIIENDLEYIKEILIMISISYFLPKINYYFSSL